MTTAKVLLACALSASITTAAARAHAQDEDAAFRRVLLISVDGLHALDLARYVQANPTSTLARLSSSGVTYSQASASRPSDSFPGLLAQLTGGSPISTGVYYDDSYDRSLSPPLSFPGGSTSCTTVGTETLYDESIDLDSTALDGGGGIDVNALPRDPSNGCSPVFPHTFLRANTIFEVAKGAHLRTAWADKHLAYEIVNGPSGHGVDDLYTPEIASNAFGPGTTGGAWTDSIPNVEAYDTFKVNAIVNEVNGLDHSGQHHVGVPAIFGMNFQAVSVAEKLPGNGYADALGTPSAGLANALDFVDASLGSMVGALAQRGLLPSTLIIVSAKHGQSPIDPNRLVRIDGDNKGVTMSPATILGNLVAHAIEDDASLMWLTDETQTASAAATLSSPSNAALAGIGEIFAGPSLDLLFTDPAHDSRTPDIVVQPNVGVVYTGKQKKIAEHGGFANDDVNVALLIANPAFSPAVIQTPVQTTQIAPTILRALGLDPSALRAVRLEHTRTLPGLRLGSA